MQNKKNVLILAISILLVISTVIICYFFLNKEKSFNNENNKKIISKEEYLGYSYYSVGHYYINNGNKYIAFNKEHSDKVAEFEMPRDKYTEITNSNIDIIKLYTYKDDIDNIYKLFNINGDILRKSKSKIYVSNDLYNNKSYYVYEKDLYNENDELILKDVLDAEKVEDNFYIYGSYFISNKKLIDLRTRETFNIDTLYNYGNYVVLTNKELFYVIDLNKDELHKYNNYIEKPYGYIIYNDENNKKVLTKENSQFLNYGEMIDYYDYKFDYTACDDGFTIYKEDKLISNECYKTYNIDTYKNVYVSNEKSRYLKNNKEYENIPIGNYYINSYNRGNIVVYNEEQKEVNNTCNYGFSYYRNGLYICNDGTYSYLVDNSFNKVTDNYDELVCSDTYCKMFKNEKYGLLYNNEIVIQPTYEEIFFENDAILAEDEYKLDFFRLGYNQSLPENELYNEINEYKAVNTNRVIEEYNLKDIENTIKENNDFFQKYAYIVINNGGLEGYKEYILKGFVEVAKNKEYLNEDYFLYSLKKLYIRVDKSLEDLDIGGLYDFGVGINILDENPNIIFHEFTHFVDDRINRNSFSSVPIYKYKDTYISPEEYKTLSEIEKKNVEYYEEIEFEFLAEAGAEINSSIYLRNYVTTAYAYQISYYNMFSYIFGSDTMREIYFSKEGNFTLLKKLSALGYSFEEIKSFANITEITYKRTNKDTMFCLDIMIDLYEKEKGNKWYENKEFSYFVSFILPYNLKKDETDRYAEYKKIIGQSSSISEKIYEKFENVKYVSSSPGIYYNDKVNISVNIQIIENNELKNNTWIVDYNFEKDEILDYKIIEE